MPSHFHSNLERGLLNGIQPGPITRCSFKACVTKYFLIRHRAKPVRLGHFSSTTKDPSGILYNKGQGSPSPGGRSFSPALPGPSQTPELGAVCSQLASACGTVFCRSYAADRREAQTRWPTASANARFQLYRRGRYVEIQSRLRSGTIFGLQRQRAGPKSILMSLPPLVRWEYGYTPEPAAARPCSPNLSHCPQDWLQDESLKIAPTPIQLLLSRA